MILAAYNEEVSIGIVVLLARRYADRVMVVDDGSSDRTTEIAAIARSDQDQILSQRSLIFLADFFYSYSRFFIYS